MVRVGSIPTMIAESNLSRLIITRAVTWMAYFED
jgi:hypothetical protein